jgi:YD repeat-containing protein
MVEVLVIILLIVHARQQVTRFTTDANGNIGSETLPRWKWWLRDFGKWFILLLVISCVIEVVRVIVSQFRF